MDVETCHKFVPPDVVFVTSVSCCAGDIILSFFKIIVGFVTEATSHVIVTYVPRFKSHPLRDELDTGTDGVTSKVNVDDMK
jgi:hypothetical protein